MAGTSGYSLHFTSSQLSDSSCAATGGSKDYVTACASEVDVATTSSLFGSALGESVREGGAGSVEEQIERSKSHWSELSEYDCEEGEEAAEVSNVAEFRALQWHSTWGGFFQTFGYDIVGGRYPRMGELVMGRKFAEGGQAELYEAQVQWWYPEGNEKDVKGGCEYVVKVFKKGTFLKHLKSQLPRGLLQFHAKQMEEVESGTFGGQPRFFCKVHRGILLKDGRFGFLMEREHVDLRNFIEHHVMLKSSKDGGPFSKEYAEIMMYDIALGLKWLHNHDIVHRDLKAANVLVKDRLGFYPECFIADYECSVGVVGTGFFRAPEILQVCKDGSVSKRQEVFSKAADIYSYGMVCYEVLTGKAPFQDDKRGNHLLMDLVIKEHLRPKVPKYVEDWTRELFNMCWQSDPKVRPRIEEILGTITKNSLEAKRKELFVTYGQNFTSCDI